MVTNYYVATYQPCLDRLGGNFTPEVSALITDFKDVIGRWSAGSGSPHTLVHGDFRPTTSCSADAGRAAAGRRRLADDPQGPRPQ